MRIIILAPTPVIPVQAGIYIMDPILKGDDTNDYRSSKSNSRELLDSPHLAGSLKEYLLVFYLERKN